MVVLADRSASLPSGAEKEQLEIITRLQRDMKSGQRLGVISLGERTAVEQSAQEGVLGGFTADVGIDQSRLAEGLERAMSLIPPDTPGRILVLSDGHWTGRDPLETAQRMALRDFPMDYRFLSRPALADLSIDSVSAPPFVAAGQSFLVHAWINSPEDQTADYVLTRNGKRIASGSKKLTMGSNRMVFRDQLAVAGSAAYQLEIKADGKDPIEQNNRARFMVGIGGDLPVLCITQTPGGALGQLLSSTGMRVEMKQPHEMDWTLENLSRYSGVVLENIAASDIGMHGMELLAAWVETTGRGLMISGGKRSYGAGGYFRSPLERILPVSMELRREHRKLALAIAVVLDRSGSMGAPVDGGKTKMDLANIGTVQVLDLLSEMDEMGVLAVDSAAHTILDLKSVEECRLRRNDILQIESMGGGIFVYEGLVEASKMLVGASAGTRHIILFADAADAEQPGEYKELLEHNKMANITVSVVALGNPGDSDADLLRDIAKRGEGEIYFTQDAMEIPRIFAQDTFAVARSTFLEEPTGFTWTPLMRLISGGQEFSQPSTLGGYNLSYLRDGAQMLAVSQDEYAAPIVSGWQAGAGRVLCYSGEIDGAFTGPIANWAEYGGFLAGMVRWTAGDHSPLPNDAMLVQEVKNGVCTISLHLDPARIEESFSGTPRVKVLRSKPNQELRTDELEMQWKNADLLQVDLPLNGSETLVASVSVGDHTPVPMPPACLTYSPEYRTKAPGSGLEALKKLSTVSGGRERIKVGNIWSELPAPWRKQSLRPILILLAVVLFLLEISDRRIGLRLQRTKPAPVFKVRKKGKSAKTNIPKIGKVEKTIEEKQDSSAMKAARAKAKSRFKR